MIFFGLLFQKAPQKEREWCRRSLMLLRLTTREGKTTYESGPDQPARG